MIYDTWQYNAEEPLQASIGLGDVSLEAIETFLKKSQD